MTTAASKKTTKKSPLSSVMKKVAAKDAAKAKERASGPDEIVEPVATKKTAKKSTKKPATRRPAAKPAKKGTATPKKPARATPANDAAKTAKPKKLSGLNCAAEVLAKSKEPLAAKAIAEQVIAMGWKTNGATPHATLYAAMIREIKAKGKDARFVKTDRGLFAAGKGA